MYRALKVLLISSSACLFPALAWAQAGPEAAAALPQAGNFFMTVLAGVLLAFGFQVLLTSLSVALGITAAGNIEKKFHESSPDSEDDEKESSTPLISKITGAMGVWTVVTISVSLFFASMLAVKLSLLPVESISVTLGLVIWAAFFTLMAYLEMRSVSSLGGAVMHAAAGGIRSSLGAAHNIFSKSPEARVEDTVHRSLSAVREELFKDLDTGNIEKKIDEYLGRLQPRELDLDKVREELALLLNDLQVEEIKDAENRGINREFLLKIAEKQPRVSKSDAKKIAGVFEKIKSSGQGQTSPSGRLMNAIDKLTPGTEEEGRAYREKIEEYLRSTRREELNPDSIRRDIDRMVSDPSSSKDVIVNRLQRINTSTLASVLTRRNDVNKEEINKILENVKNAISAVKEKAGGDGGNGGGSGGGKAQAVATAAAQTVKQTAAGISSRAEEKISAYLNSMESPEFNYDSLKSDFIRMFQDPKASPEILKQRLRQYDRESLVKLLSSRENVSREDAEKMVGKIEEARDEVLRRAVETERTVREKVRAARDAALHQAENTRKAAAAAAWWLFAAAVISGAASSLGAIAAL